MNRSFRLAALALSLAAAGSAFAESPVATGGLPSISVATRTEVRAQVLPHAAAVTEADLNKATPTAGTLTRAQVKADTLAAIARGELHPIGGDISPTGQPLLNVARVTTPGATQLAQSQR